MNPYRRVVRAGGNVKRGVGFDGVWFARKRIASAAVAVAEEAELASRMQRELDDLEALVWGLVEQRVGHQAGEPSGRDSTT